MSAILNWIAWYAPMVRPNAARSLAYLTRLVHARLRQPGAQRRDRDPALVQDGQEVGVAAAALAEQVRRRHAAVGERQLAGVGGVPADLGVFLRRGEARPRHRHQDRGDLLPAAGQLAGHRGHRDQLGDARCPELVMNALVPLITHSPSSSRAVVRVAPASEPPPGSVSPNAPSACPRAQPRQPLLLLLLGAEAVDRHRAERDPGLQRDRDRRVDPGQLLDGQAEREVVAAHPAVLLRERQAEQAHLAHLLDHRVRELGALVVVERRRRDDRPGEVGDGAAEGFLLVVERVSGMRPIVSRRRDAAGEQRVRAAHVHSSGCALLDRLGTPWRVLAKEISAFGVVGVVNLFVDVGLFNLLHFRVGLGPTTSNIISDQRRHHDLLLRQPALVLLPPGPHRAAPGIHAVLR